MSPFENLGETSDSYSHLTELDFLGNDPQIKNSNSQLFYSESKERNLKNANLFRNLFQLWIFVSLFEVMPSWQYNSESCYLQWKCSKSFFCVKIIFLTVLISGSGVENQVKDLRWNVFRKWLTAERKRSILVVWQCFEYVLMPPKASSIMEFVFQTF